MTCSETDLGVSFPNLVGEIHPETAPLQALYCALCLYRTEHFSRGEKGQKVSRQRRKWGRPNKGQNQKPGNHPNFEKDALGVKRPFSEQLSELRGILGAILGMALTTSFM